MGMLNDTGEPTQRYYDFLDQTQSKKIVAIGIQEAYEDLFNLNKDAQNLTQEEVKNKLKTLTQGMKSESVIEKWPRHSKLYVIMLIGQIFQIFLNLTTKKWMKHLNKTTKLP